MADDPSPIPHELQYSSPAALWHTSELPNPRSLHIDCPMDYSYYTGPRPQPFSLYGLPTPDQQPQTQTDEAFADSFSLVRPRENPP